MMHEFSVDAFYDLAVAGYRWELTRLVETVGTDTFRKALPDFTKKKKLSDLQRRGTFRKLLQSASTHEGYSMDASTISETELAFYTYINMAAAAFFEGWTIPVSDIPMNMVDSYVNSSIPATKKARESMAANIAERLNRADTMRVTMALKLLNLLPGDSHRRRQLSLGAYLGNRDLEFMHQQPSITGTTQLTNSLRQPTKRTPPLAFGTNRNQVHDAVLVDIDPAVAATYSALNESSRGRVLALNTDVLVGLELLHKEILDKKKRYRDLVVLFRLEPLMLPDVDLFFGHLRKVIEDQTTLLITVGAGDDDESYRLRKTKMDEIAGKLLNRGFAVQRFKWCRGSKPEEQRKHPVMGLGSYSSYDIICSKISRTAL